MANKKITDLTSLPSADGTDVLPVVDVSANSTKKVTVAGLAPAVAANLPNDSVTPPMAGDLAKAVNRKDHNTANVVTDQLIQTGWGFMAGTGAAFVTGSITFPVAYDSAPVLVVGSLGRKDGTDPTSISEFNLDVDMWAHSSSITTTGAAIVIESVSGATQASGRRIGFSWIAIGTKAR